MTAVGLLGISWRHATTEIIGRYALPLDSRTEALRALARALEVDELLVLGTCNRAEWLYAGGASLSAPERRRRLIAQLRGIDEVGHESRLVRAWDGEGAIEHLFLVAAGLDSARIGESEIAGQLRSAAEECEGAGLLGPTLKALVGDALRVARQVRPITEGRIGRASLADVAVDAIRARSDLRARGVALVGVSPMTERCAVLLRRDGIPLSIVNRTPERAQSLAARVDADVRALADFVAAPGNPAAVVLATAARDPVLPTSALEALASGGAPPTLLVDFGASPNVDHVTARSLALETLTMDAITRRAESGRERSREDLAEARAMVDAALDARRRRAWAAAVNPAIVTLRSRMETRARDEVNRVLGDELSTLEPAERTALRAWAEGLARRLAHVPSRGLRDLASQMGPEAAAAFLATAAPDLAASLRTHGSALD